MKYSRTALKVLKAQYLSVLKKCALINAGLFFLAAPAVAAVANVGNFNDFMKAWRKSDTSEINLGGDLTATSGIGTAASNEVTINGGGHNFNGDGKRGIWVYSGQKLKISNVGDVSDIDSEKPNGFNGFHSEYDGSDSSSGRGGAIYNVLGDITVKNSVFSGNEAKSYSIGSGGSGGAIYNVLGDITIENSVFSGNSSNFDDGAIYNSGTLTVTGSDFRDNSATRGSGGAIGNRGTLTVTDSVFSGNSSYFDGGAIENSSGTINIVADNKDTTFTGNTVGKVSNALYNFLSTTNLNAGEHKIVFNDGIDGHSSYKDRNIININKSDVDISAKQDKSEFAPTSGVVEFNNLVQNNTVNLYGGTLKLGSYTYTAADIVQNDKVDNSFLLGKTVYGNFANDVDFVAEGGTLDIGTNQVVARSAEFKDGSTLAVTVNTDEHGSFHANNLTVNEGANLKATLAQGLVGRGEEKGLQLVSAANNWDDNFMLAHDNNMYKFEKGDTAGEYIVTLAQTAEDVVKESGGTQNNANAAKAWVDGDKFPAGTNAQALADKLAGLAQNNAQGFNDALTALAPEVAPVVKTAVVDHSNQIFNAVSTRMSGGSVGSAAEGMSSGDSLLDGGATWVQLLANKTKFDGNRKAHGFDSKSAGLAMGAEKYINEDVKAGVGYAYTNSDIDSFMRDTDVDTHTVFAYGEYKPSNWFVNGVASYSFSDYDESKNVVGSRYKAKYDVDNFGLQLMTGYDTMLGKVEFTPTAGLRYNSIHRDSYKDTADQRVSSDNMDVLTAVMGAKIYKNFITCGGTHWKPEARLAMTYDVVSDKENAVVGLLNGSSYFVEGERLNRFGIEAGLGLQIDINENVETSVGYEGRFREDYQDHTGLINAKYKF